MFDHESKIPKENILSDRNAFRMRNIFLDIHTEEIFQQGEASGILRGQLHVARLFLCLVLRHRFGDVPKPL